MRFLEYSELTHKQQQQQLTQTTTTTHTRPVEHHQQQALSFPMADQTNNNNNNNNNINNNNFRPTLANLKIEAEWITTQEYGYRGPQESCYLHFSSTGNECAYENFTCHRMGDLGEWIEFSGFDFGKVISRKQKKKENEQQEQQGFEDLVEIQFDSYVSAKDGVDRSYYFEIKNRKSIEIERQRVKMFDINIANPEKDGVSEYK